MGSASREALASARRVLDGLTEQALLGFGRELLDSSAKLDSSPQLLTALSDPSADAEAKKKLVEQLFSSAQIATRTILTAVAEERWSTPEELVAGVEELGIRAEAQANPSLDEELLAVEAVIGGNHDLELSLGSKLGDSEAKSAVVQKLFHGKVSEGALAVTQHLVANPRGRRLGRVLKDSAKIVADQSGAELATVTVARPLDSERLERLEKSLAVNAGRPVKITTVVDPDVVGGIRIELADSIIDGSVRARLDDLRLQLAG